MAGTLSASIWFLHVDTTGLCEASGPPASHRSDEPVGASNWQWEGVYGPADGRSRRARKRDPLANRRTAERIVVLQAQGQPALYPCGAGRVQVGSRPRPSRGNRIRSRTAWTNGFASCPCAPATEGPGTQVRPQIVATNETRQVSLEKGAEPRERMTAAIYHKSRRNRTGMCERMGREREASATGVPARPPARRHQRKWPELAARVTP